jgi:hypothetical protein
LGTSTQEILYDLAEAGKAKNTSFNVMEFDKIVQVQISEYLYGIKHIADYSLKVVACSSDRVAFVS